MMRPDRLARSKMGEGRRKEEKKERERERLEELVQSNNMSLKGLWEYLD